MLIPISDNNIDKNTNDIIKYDGTPIQISLDKNKPTWINYNKYNWVIGKHLYLIINTQE